MEPKENNSKRTEEQIKAEYHRVSMQAGDMSYRIVCFKQDLAKLHNRMLELNEEAMALAEEKVQNEQPKAE